MQISLAYPEDTFIPMEENVNYDYQQIVSEIKNANLSALFSHILIHKENIEKQISENKNKFIVISNPKMTIAMAVIVATISTIIIPVSMYGVIKSMETSSELYEFLFLCMTIISISICVSSLFLLDCDRSIRNKKLTILSKQFNQLDTVNQIRIKSMLEAIINFDQNINSNADIVPLLKKWISCKDPNRYYEKFLSSMYEYLPEDDIIRTHMTTICKSNASENERIRAWKYLEVELETPIQYIESNNTKFVNPKKIITIDGTSKLLTTGS
jgi:hypothetical protein